MSVGTVMVVDVVAEHVGCRVEGFAFLRLQAAVRVAVGGAGALPANIGVGSAERQRAATRACWS